jgi:hypothetical protein
MSDCRRETMGKWSAVATTERQPSDGQRRRGQVDFDAVLNIRIRISIFVGLFALASGCSKSPADVAPLHGHVTLDGRPLSKASVAFASPGRPPTGGYTDQDGNYEAYYRRGIKGAPIGMYRVTILEDTAATHGPQRVPARYNENSDIQRDVKPGDNVFDFDLTTAEK